MNIRVILAIMRKDVVDAIKNQFILAFLALPLGLALLLRLVFPNSLTDLQQLTVVTYDPGHSRLVATLQEMPNIRILKADSNSQLMESVRVNKAVGGLVVPPDFDASVEARKQPKLTAYLNYRQDEVKRRAFQRLMQQQITALTPPPATIAWVDIDPPLESQTKASSFLFEDFLLVMMLLLSMVVTGMMIIPMLLVEEKEKRTLSFLLVSPACTTDIVVGKALVGFMYSLAITGVVVGLSHAWKGNWGITLLALFLGSLFTVPVGLLLGVIFSNAIQLNTWATVPLLLLLLPSWLSVSQVPAVQAFVRLIPTHYLVDTLNLSLAGEASIAKAWSNLAMLFGSTVIAFAIAIWALRR